MNNVGTVVSVRGSVMNAAFLKRFLNQLNVGNNGKVILEVMAYVTAEVVR
jgi:hypothetical protein